MRVWKDIISGDEMITDAFTITTLFDDAALEAKARFVSKKENDDCGIAANTEEGEEEAELKRLSELEDSGSPGDSCGGETQDSRKRGDSYERDSFCCSDSDVEVGQDPNQNQSGHCND